MYKTVGATQVDKCPERAQTTDPAASYLSLTQFFKKPLALDFPPVTLGCRGRQDQSTVAPVDLYHLDLQLLSDFFREASQFLLLAKTLRETRDLRGRYETPDILDRDHQATLVVANDLSLQDLATLG